MTTGIPTRTTCPYCGVGCGVIATFHGDGRVAIAGDPDHPANFGRLCSKGSALGETLDLSDRLLRPEVEARRTTWEEALGTVAQRFAQCIAEHGAESVAFYVSGQLLTEDYYVANKLMKGFIGTANIDTNSRLCMSSSVAGHIRAFGSDTVPGTYEDLEQADLVVLVGSNLAWCHPVLFQRLMAARAERGTRIVVVDPRRTVTVENADMHLPLAPESDVPLFLGLLNHLQRSGLVDRAFVDAHTSGVAEALAEASACGLEGAARATELPQADLLAFYNEWAGAERVVTVYSQGVNQSTSGTDKVNAIINCHLFTARIGRPGMGPFSVTGQPNAMGGREVGGLATMLAAHFEIGNPDHRAAVQTFWNAPRVPDKTGLKAVDLFRAVADGRIKALWVMSTNPADSMPEADIVQAAIAQCPFVVVSDVVRTDTTRHAHVLLPAAAWGEKSGTVTNSERRISRQRPFLPAPGETKPDWWIVCEIAKRMGYAHAFGFASAGDIFREYAALSALANKGTRDLDLGAYANVSAAHYDDMPPVQWPQRAGDTETMAPRRFFADGVFYTPDRRARFIRTPVPPPLLKNADYPLVLNTGRVRDQWHTMTRTNKSARLMSHITEPYCEIHPLDASEAGILPGHLVKISNAHGSIVSRALITGDQRRGSIFVPIHWTDVFASRSRIGVLARGDADSVSGQPALKSAQVKIEPVTAAWHGFAIVGCKPDAIDTDYWALARTESGWRIELAGRKEPQDWGAFAARLLGCAGEELLSYHDAGRGHRRFATYGIERGAGVLFAQPQPIAVSRSWLVEASAKPATSPLEKLRILSGRPAADQPDPGAIVCSCFNVGVNTIANAIHCGAESVGAVGNAVRAGTNCGSCRSEIQRIIASANVSQKQANGSVTRDREATVSSG